MSRQEKDHHAEARARFDGDAYIEENAPIVERNAEFIRRFDSLDKRIRKDANATAFLARQLTFQRGLIERTIYEALRAAEFVPVDPNFPRGAKSYSQVRQNHVGQAKVTADLAGDDPRVDVQVEEELAKFVNVRASYAYTVEELEAASFAGVSLPSWKGEACADVIARGLDDLGKSGNADVGLTGFFNNTNVTVHTLTNGEWDSTGTAAEIEADLQEIEQTLIDQTRDTAQPGYTLVLPSTMEGVLSTTPHNASSDMTIKEWFLRSARIITSIERYYALDGATGANVAAADPPQGICYSRNPAVLYWPMPIMYEEQAPQLSGWEWVVRARGRCGGVDVRRPTHMLYVENLD